MILLYGTQKKNVKMPAVLKTAGIFRGGCGFWGAPEKVTDRGIVVC